jgi:hypothetical protein
MELIKQLALDFGVSVTKTTGTDQLDAFFKRTAPITSNHNLIRVGGQSDSGYLIPDDLEGIKSCFSPGVSLESYFENDISKMGIRSFLADYSVESPKILNPMFTFEKKFLGIENNDVFMTLDEWVAKNADPGESDMILQMDIEGGEYDVIIDTSNELLSRFRIVVIEFHNLHALFDKYGFQLISTCFYKLLKTFSIVHIHPNNCDKPIHYKNYDISPVMEFTFLNKQRITTSKQTLKFPHELDRQNSSEKKDIVLADCWYRHSK